MFCRDMATSTVPPDNVDSRNEHTLIHVRRWLSSLAGALLRRWSLHSCHGDGARQRVIGLA